MYVKLEANWFGPDGRRYRKNFTGDMLTYVPDELIAHLPSTARIAKPGGAFITPTMEEGTMLRDFDQTRMVSDAEGKMIAQAELNRANEMALDEQKKLRRQEQAARMRAAKEAKKLAKEAKE